LTNSSEIAFRRPGRGHHVALQRAVDAIVFEHLFDHLRLGGSTDGNHFERLVFRQMLFIPHAISLSLALRFSPISSA